jgi:hypothetical protein
MDELRQQLDDEARQVEAGPDALAMLKRRAGRRRVTRQVGSRVIALAVAGAGFALAFQAFQGEPGGRPLVGPSGSISPTVEAPEAPTQEEIYAFVDRFVASRDAGSGAEAFLAPRARQDYSCCDLVLYPPDGIADATIGKFDKVNSTMWVVQVRMDYPVGKAICAPRIERLLIQVASPDQGVGGLVIRSASVMDVICQAGGSGLPRVGEGAPAALVDLQQGGTYWAVYIAVDDGGTYIRRVADRMEEQGVAVSSGEIACDHGAAEELGVPEEVLAVAAYFDTNADAAAFFAAVDPSPLGVARVQTYCQD